PASVPARRVDRARRGGGAGKRGAVVAASHALGGGHDGRAGGGGGAGVPQRAPARRLVRGLCRAQPAGERLFVRANGNRVGGVLLLRATGGEVHVGRVLRRDLPEPAGE